MMRRPPRSTQGRSSAASDVYKRQTRNGLRVCCRVCLRELKVGGIAAVVACSVGTFSVVCLDRELVRRRTADGTRICLDRAKREANTAENVVVCLEHERVVWLDGCLVAIEAVGVHHRELTASNKAIPGANLIPILVGDVIQVERQFLVGMALTADDRRDQLLMRWPQTE